MNRNLCQSSVNMQPCSEGLSQPKRQQLQGATEGLAEDRKIDFRGQGRKRTTLDEEAHDFWVRVHKAGKDECWPWLGGRNGNEHPHKYGVFKFQGKKQFAHRVCYILTHGSIPSGRIVCHHCDNPLCVNPNHLYAGTPKTNAQDCLIRGRKNVAKGSQRPNAVLTEQDVACIKHLYKTGRLRQFAIARVFELTGSQVSHIVSGRNWKHVTQVEDEGGS